MATIKQLNNNKCWQGCGELRILRDSGVNVKMVQSLWNTVWQVLKRLNIGNGGIN
jgi:hypothetical protein